MSLDRRTFLLGGAGLFVVAGCGGSGPAPAEPQNIARAVPLDFQSPYAPYPDLRRLIEEHAASVDALMTFSQDQLEPDAQVANLEQWTGEDGDFRVVAVVPYDVALVEPVIADAADVAVVSVITELEGQAAAITFDRVDAARQLLRRAPRGPALVVGPPAQPQVPEPFAPGWAPAQQVLEQGRRVAAVIEGIADADAEPAVAAALAQNPEVESVLCWNDLTALGASRAAEGRFVGGIGAPWVSGLPTLDAVGRGIDCLVAVRLRELAEAIVDVPLSYAKEQGAGSFALEPVVLRRTIPALRAFRKDFSA